MQTFVVQAVQRSADGGKSVRVISRWPYAAEGLDAAKAFVDATPPFGGWDKANAFEILDLDCSLRASRSLGPEEHATWVDSVSEN